MMVTGMPFYPIFLDLAEKRVVVVGGGPVAVRKTRGLIEAGARVTVVAPELSAKLPVTWKARRYRSGDLHGATLAFTATDDRRVNARVATDAKALGVPVNVADSPAEGDFLVPARVRKNGFHIAISTDGANPRASAALRRRLENAL